MQELRGTKTIIHPLERVGIVHSIGELIKTDYYVLIKIVVDIYEGTLENKPYKLEFYCYDKEVVDDALNLNIGDFVMIRYRTRSKTNKNTKMFYTNNVCYKISTIDKNKLLTFNSNYYV